MLTTHSSQVKDQLKTKANQRLGYKPLHDDNGGPGSVVGIATGYELDGLGIESWWGRSFKFNYT